MNDKEYIEKISPYSSLKIFKDIEIYAYPFYNCNGEVECVQKLYINGKILLKGIYLKLPNIDGERIEILRNLDNFDRQ